VRSTRFGNLGPAGEWGLNHVISTGQSLSVSTESNVSISTQPYNNKMLHDGSATYDITLPNAATLSLQPLVGPQRTTGPGQTAYPANLEGSDAVDISFANEVTRIAIANDYNDYRIATSTVGVGGQPMSVIQKGGSGTSYAASLYECRAIKRLAGLAGLTFGTRAVMLRHGETDDENQNLSYATQLATLASNYQTDLQTITGQTVGVYLFGTQCNQNPQSFHVGENVTALAFWAAAVANPGLVVLVGPQYQFAYSPFTFEHMQNYGPLGELHAKVFWIIERTGTWTPLWPTSVVRVGTAVTITFNVPVGPLVFDGVASPPHAGGTPWNAWWGGAKGFEAYDRLLTVSSATNASPIVIGFTTPHGLNTGDPYALTAVVGNTATNGVWSAVTFVDSTHVSLNGSTGNGAYTSGGIGFSPIGVGAPSISGNQVSFTMARSPVGTPTIAYAHHSDRLYGAGLNTGGFPLGRCGLLRDSDPWVSGSGFQQFNWCIEFAQAAP
jgi:hypothetical protein